jgi:hypothetical protein
LLPEPQRLSISWRITVVGAFVAAYLLFRLWPWIRVAFARLERYEELYRFLVAERQRLVDERKLVDNLLKALAGHALESRSVQTVTFTITDSMIRGSDLLIVLQPDTVASIAFSPIPPVGSTLMLTDPSDYFRMADVEVVSTTTREGHPMARVRNCDSLFLTYLRDKAIAREPLQTQVIAIHTIQSS